METRAALLKPKRGYVFSEMCAWWVCVTAADERGITCVEGTTGNWSVKRYATAEELEKRYRYTSLDAHWIDFMYEGEENAEKYEERFVNHFTNEDDRRDARIKLLME